MVLKVNDSGLICAYLLSSCLFCYTQLELFLAFAI